MKGSILFLACLFCLGCGGVQASSPAQVSCSPVVMQLGDDGRSPSFKVQYGPCTIMGDGAARSEDSYTLRNSATVCEAHSWLGTLTGSKIEVGFEWLFIAPDGRYLFSVPNQYDKHQDVVGSHWSNVVNFRTSNGSCRRLDPGTKIVIQQASGVQDFKRDCPANGCGMHTILYVTGSD